MPDPTRAAAAALLLVAVACAAGDESTVADRSSPVTIDSSLVAELCTARASVGDIQAAADTFARAHGSLHDLARELADHDRARAGRLHEAKQRVEAALRATPSPDAQVLTVRLDRLIDATRRGLDRLDVTVPSPCPSQQRTAPG